MKVVQPSFEILTECSGSEVTRMIERAARTCYKTEPGDQEATNKFVRGLIKSGHLAMIEHYNITVKFICDRGVSHEIVRHRIASYAQESTRYCNYSKDKFGAEITVIQPNFLEPGTHGYMLWEEAMLASEKAYFDLLNWGCSPQQARSVLPNSLKTEIVVTMNLREWRHFFSLRAIDTPTNHPHPQMKQSAAPVLAEFKRVFPIFFEDIVEVPTSV